jgi:hypothetical protein
MTLADLCDELGIEVVSVSESARRPGQTCAKETLQKILTKHGEGHLRSVLITIMETTNNRRMLVRPVILAVSDVLRSYPHWFGDKWLKQFDRIELALLYEAAKLDRVAAPRYAMATRLLYVLRPHFDAPARPRLI